MSPADPPSPSTPIKGRGTTSRLAGRFEHETREAFDDGWDLDEDPPPRPDTTVTAEPARSIISRNRSPDIPFVQSINPYRGCEHGCSYCYARPSHAYLNLSPGLDFETKLFYKANAAELLEKELRNPGYRCTPINLGANTDPYQPVERELGVTRSILEVLWRYRHPATLVTKGGTVVLRDLELFRAMAEQRLFSAAISMTTLDAELKRRLEPRAAGPAMRLRVIRALSGAGVPVTALVAPVIPFINDHEIEALLEASAEAGASNAGYVLLRLPHEVAPLFREWLETHAPLKAQRVLNVLRAMRGGKDYDARYGHRHRGNGKYAELIAQRFDVACRRLGLNRRAEWRLDTSAFHVPAASGDQIALF